MILYALRDGYTYRVGFVDIDLLNMDIGFVSMVFRIYVCVLVQISGKMYSSKGTSHETILLLILWYCFVHLCFYFQGTFEIIAC